MITTIISDAHLWNSYFCKDLFGPILSGPLLYTYVYYYHDTTKIHIFYNLQVNKMHTLAVGLYKEGRLHYILVNFP